MRIKFVSKKNQGKRPRQEISKKENEGSSSKKRAKIKEDGDDNKSTKIENKDDAHQDDDNVSKNDAHQDDNNVSKNDASQDDNNVGKNVAGHNDNNASKNDAHQDDINISNEEDNSTKPVDDAKIDDITNEEDPEEDPEEDDEMQEADHLHDSAKEVRTYCHCDPPVKENTRDLNFDRVFALTKFSLEKESHLCSLNTLIRL